MSANFFKLPRELRDRVYELCLLLQEPINIWIGFDKRKKLTPGLFRANKAVHREAGWLFYSQNRFNFTMVTPREVASFLGSIGRSNANYIRHVRVDFPNLRDLEPSNVTIEEGSISILGNIQSCCANLSTLTTSLHSTTAMALKLDSLDYPKIINEALKLVNTRFRAISSIQDIIVEVDEDGPSYYIRRKMESYGWTISATEYVDDCSIEDEWNDYDLGDCDYIMAYDFWRTNAPRWM